MTLSKYFKYKLNFIRGLIKEKHFRTILYNPFNSILLGYLIIRSIILRLIPHKTKVYFIRKQISKVPVIIKDSEFIFKVFEEYTEEIEIYCKTRCSESENIFFDQYSKLLHQRFHDGFSACSLLDKGGVCSIFFTSNKTHFIDQVNYSFQPHPKEIAISDIYTIKRYRQQGLYLLMFTHVVNYYANKNYTSIVMWIMQHNRATINAQIKAGFTEVFQTVTMFSWFGLKINSLYSTPIPLNKL